MTRTSSSTVNDRSDPAKQARAEEWIAHFARSRTGRLSFQDLQHGHAFGDVRVVDPFRSRELAAGEIEGPYRRSKS